jgi:hypothetical protein
MPEKGCNCLKKIDMTGVPVSLNWQGNNEHTTRVGGFFSMIGCILVLIFTYGAVMTY